MADMAGMQAAIEYVRSEFERERGLPFEKTLVKLSTGGSHTFNAVAADRSVVASITNSSGPTSSGKNPVGKIKAATADLYYLSLVSAPMRWLVMTNPDFFDIMKRELAGALAPGIELRLVELPQSLRAAIDAVSESASRELR